MAKIRDLTRIKEAADGFRRLGGTLPDALLDRWDWSATTAADLRNCELVKGHLDVVIDAVARLTETMCSAAHNDSNAKVDTLTGVLADILYDDIDTSIAELRCKLDDEREAEAVGDNAADDLHQRRKEAA